MRKTSSRAPGLDFPFQSQIHEIAKGVQTVACERHAGGHGVAAALDRHAGVKPSPHRAGQDRRHLNFYLNLFHFHH